MKSVRRVCPIGSTLAVMLALVLSGCIADRQYVYKEIRKEYHDVACSISPVELEAEDPASCALNRPVSLTEAVEIALENNPDSKMALYRIRQAKAAMKQAESRFFPSVSLYTEYLQGDAPSAFLFKTIDQRQLPENVNFNEPGWFENFESGVAASVNLYNGGRDFLDKRMAGNLLATRELDRHGVENGLVAAVIKAFYNAAAAEAFVEIARESVTTVNTELDIMQVKLEAGGALKSDVLSLEVRLAQAREDVILHENRLKTALTVLSNLLGLSPEMGIQLGKADLTPPELPPEYLAGLAAAMANRPEVRKARQAVIRSKMALDRADAGYLPRLDFMTRYYLDDPSLDYSSERGNWTASLMLNWNVFNGFSTKAEKMKAEAALAEMIAADRKAVLSVKTEVRSAYLNLEAAEARLAVARKSVDSAEETLKLVQRQFEGGSATITRYLEAELSRNRSRTRRAAAFYDREKAAAELGRAVGYWAAETHINRD